MTAKKKKDGGQRNPIMPRPSYMWIYVLVAAFIIGYSLYGAENTEPVRSDWNTVEGMVRSGDVERIEVVNRDVAEPYRKGFIPGYDALKEQVLAGGALAMNIAGSGPSVFALASNYEAAVRISGEMKRHFEGLGIGCNSYAGRVSNAGARVVE